jgi:uncharacterized protein
MLTALKICGVLFLVYGGLVLLLAGCQRKMIYFPTQASEERLLREAQSKKMSAWRSDDGELVGWKSSLSQSEKGGKALVVFHGNAGYALHRDYFVNGFLALEDGDLGAVYIFEYPGYGARKGSPAEAKFKADAGEAVAGLFDHHDRLFLVGESLGTGVATHLAERFSRQIDGLLLITPFTSLVEVGRKHYPFFPVNMILRQRYDNIGPLQSYGGPVAFLIAGADEIIPPSLGHKLFEIYSGPKRIWIQEGRGHNSLNYDPQALWWKEVMDFLQVREGQDVEKKELDKKFKTQ